MGHARCGPQGEKPTILCSQKHATGQEGGDPEVVGGGARIQILPEGKREIPARATLENCSLFSIRDVDQVKTRPCQLQPQHRVHANLLVVVGTCTSEIFQDLVHVDVTACESKGST